MKGSTPGQAGLNYEKRERGSEKLEGGRGCCQVADQSRNRLGRARARKEECGSEQSLDSPSRASARKVHDSESRATIHGQAEGRKPSGPSV